MKASVNAHENDVVLMGPARSGTTLVCALLNQLPNVVALDEPFTRDDISRTNARAFPDFVSKVFLEQRDSVLRKGSATSTQIDCRLSNHYDSSTNTRTGLRSRVVNAGAIDLRKAVADDFLLIVKHTIPFTANAASLGHRFRAFALVRNPLAILASWNSIDAAYRKGRVQPYAARLAPQLAARLAGIEDRFMRQVTLLDWHFEQYAALQEVGAVLRYEDIIATNGKALDAMASGTAALSSRLESCNTNPLYDNALVDQLADKLLAYRGASFDHYSERDIEILREQIVGDLAIA